MVKVAIFGAKGGLAQCLINDCLKKGCFVDAISREVSNSKNNLENLKIDYPNKLAIKSVKHNYSEFQFKTEYDILIMTQSIFTPKELIKKSDTEIDQEINVGFTEIIKITKNFLSQFPPKNNDFKNIAIIGSTSAYSAKTTTYCGIKHGLVGFIRALNDEYLNTNYRFFLFFYGNNENNYGKQNC